MKIVISALHFDWSDIGHCLGRVFAEFGLDGVELSLDKSFARPHCTAADLNELAKLAAARSAYLSGHIWENMAQLGPERGASALLSWLEICKRTGLSALIMHGGSFPDRAEGIQRTAAALDAVADRFFEAGVELYAENHYAFDYKSCNELFSEPWEFRQILGRHPNIGFCFDTGHGNMTRNSKQLLRELAGFLRYVHLADNHGTDDDHCPYGTGTVEWPEIFGLLRQLEFDGVFCIEFPVRHDEAPLRACVTALLEKVSFNANPRRGAKA